MDYRRITRADVDKVTALAMEALALSSDLPVHVSREKVRFVVDSFAAGPMHLQMAAFDDDGIPVAALAMYVQSMLFHERYEGQVMMCFAKVPGTGAVLIRAMMAYVAKDIRIQRVQWCMNEQPDPRFARMVQRRFGFAQRLDNFVFYKG